MELNKLELRLCPDFYRTPMQAQLEDVEQVPLSA